ncbi:hypothetical protein BTJ39_03660 [Izhakiella australiensis]|uniref:Type III secretion system protein PrgJ n=1 Tax=Izhakiella australiensis TaxID=1926881 RepID=A0A1S8YQM9_9GAMM|nr:type III secretion system inner rod subunit SctI [Izhakiella australiensis]OON41077.1 hypothetical protein BTJ39_03660 [Izhakiella australiensis]
MSDIVSPLVNALGAASRSGGLQGHGGDSVLMSLDDRLGHAFASKAVESQHTREEIYAALNDPNVTSNPAQLIEWQKRLSIYTLETNLCSTMVRKGVAAIETLIKT